MKQITSFNGLRFFAILIIVLYHIKRDVACCYSGYLAVDLFFILSGFLLAKTYEKLSQSYQNDSLYIAKAYFSHRFSRLWPEYFFAVFISIFLLGNFSKFQTHPIFLNIFMTSDIAEIPNFLHGSWFVPVIFWCNCLLFSLLAFGKEKTKGLILPIIAIICLFHLVSRKKLDLHVQLTEFAHLSDGTIRGLFGCIIGIYTYWACQALKNYKANWRPMFLKSILLIGEIISVIWLGYILIFQKKFNMIFFDIYFYVPFLIGLLYFQKEKLLKFLSWKITASLGTISYSLYLSHFTIILFFKKMSLKGFEAYERGILTVLLSIALAFLNYYGAKYLIKFLKKIAFTTDKNEQ